MKTFLKYFSLAFICFFMAFLLGTHTFLKMNANNENDIGSHEEKIKEGEKLKDNLEKGEEEKGRVNFILLGKDDLRTDSILFISFDRKLKTVDLISIPRDTYLYRKGYEKAEQRKINSVYGDHGVEGVKEALYFILGETPIDHYIILDYKGVENIIDSVGGVEVNIPFHMKYEDPTANPPLYIDIPKGVQVLNGEKSVQFLRYRKGSNNKEGYAEGDLGRIKAQQEFVFSFFKKSLGIRLPLVIKNSFKEIETDMGLNEALKYGKEILEMEEEDFNLFILPGVASYRTFEGKTLSYYIQDEVKTKELMEKIYKASKKVPVE